MKSQLLAMSFDAPASPWITLKALPAGESRLAGWGFAWYPTDDYAAMVFKDPTPTFGTRMAELIGDWSRFRSTVFVCHIRGAAKRVTQQDTHPFARSHAGRSFVFAHAGDLVGDWRNALPLGQEPVFEPLGRTDSEWAFCWLLTRLRETGKRRLAEVGWETVVGWLRQIDALGTTNLLLSDGSDLVAYHDGDNHSALHWCRRLPPYSEKTLGNDALELDTSDPRDHSRTAILISTSPLSTGEWRPLEAGQMLVARRGAVMWDSANSAVSPASPPPQATANPVNAVINVERPIEVGVHFVPAEADTPAVSTPAETVPAQPRTRVAPEGRLGTVAGSAQGKLAVIHETVYSYQTPVEHSSHYFRLYPVYDQWQEVETFSIVVEPRTAIHTYEDVFGNQAMELELSGNYSELRITSRANVRLYSMPDLHRRAERWTIPLVWMPWQRQMMSPYLLPPELPESQLRELWDFAMSFVERQDYDLVETLVDMNQSLYRDFRYIPGSTTLETTPFDVYVHRQGVCQDFANLFICLARLLSIPARYRVGYIHTGADYENRIQSEASHAWAELYLPSVGWRGFDPTNGCLAETNHIRVAAGRNYRDATPTAGTIFKGGVGEVLRVSVQVEPF